MQDDLGGTGPCRGFRRQAAKVLAFSALEPWLLRVATLVASCPRSVDIRGAQPLPEHRLLSPRRACAPASTELAGDPARPVRSDLHQSAEYPPLTAWTS